MLHRPFGILNRFLPAEPASAHCDIPCGIYDPHGAQIAAQTVVRMVQLAENLPKPGEGATKAEQDAYHNTLSRYITVKEQHADLCKKELLVLWGDYFKPPHLQQFPELHTIFWDTMRLASTNKQQLNLQAAQDLVSSVQRIAEIFWTTKGASVRRQPSLQPIGGESVYPAS